MAKFSTTMFTAIVVLLGFFVSISVVTAGDDCVKAACSGTPYVDSCVSVLSENRIPNSACPDARGLAELAIQATSSEISLAALHASSEHWNDAAMSSADEKCFNDCGVKLEDASKTLKLESKSKLEDVRSFLAESKTKKVDWNCDACRRGDDKKKVDRISVGNNSEKMMAVLPVLIDRALPK